MTVSKLSPLIEAIDAKALIHNLPADPSKNAGIKFIDARFDLGNPHYGNEAYQASHIPDALRVDLDMDICAPKTGHNGRHPLKSQDALIALFQDLGINVDDRVIVYDDKSGMFASHIWWILRHLGHENVQVMNGGFSKWQSVDGAISSDIPNIHTRGNIIARESDFNLIPLSEVLRFVEGNRHEKLQLLDARGSARFRGEVEPLDPIAGHIPTAINYPFEQNLNSEGLFKDAETLHQQWSTFLGDIAPSTLVNQCGSGVSACHNLFALYYAGFGPTQLYHGSWSEWCADKSRPMVTSDGLID